jgi:hypothetical protein
MDMPGLSHMLPVNRVRRNHALEHATITIVTERNPEMMLTGRSNRKGFYIFGRIPTEDLASAITEALRRLRGGEAELAIHPRCGTNFAVAGLMSGLSAALASRLKPRRNRFGYAVLAALGALTVAPRVGSNAQLLTTSAQLAGLEVTGISKRRFWRLNYHFVNTRS